MLGFSATSTGLSRLLGKELGSAKLQLRPSIGPSR